MVVIKSLNFLLGSKDTPNMNRLAYKEKEIDTLKGEGKVAKVLATHGNKFDQNKDNEKKKKKQNHKTKILSVPLFKVTKDFNKEHCRIGDLQRKNKQIMSMEC